MRNLQHIQDNNHGQMYQAYLKNTIANYSKNVTQPIIVNSFKKL